MRTAAAASGPYLHYLALSDRQSADNRPATCPPAETTNTYSTLPPPPRLYRTCERNLGRTTNPPTPQGRRPLIDANPQRPGERHGVPRMVRQPAPERLARRF